MIEHWHPRPGQTTDIGEVDFKHFIYRCARPMRKGSSTLYSLYECGHCEDAWFGALHFGGSITWFWVDSPRSPWWKRWFKR